MDPVVVGGLACVLYLASAAIKLFSLYRQVMVKQAFVVATASLAVGLHAYFCYQEIYTYTGVNIGIYPMASFTSLAITTIVLLSSLWRSMDNLLMVLFPFAALSMLLTLAQEGTYTPRTDISYGITTHIVLSVVAYGILAIAALQAVLLSLSHYGLKHHKRVIWSGMLPLQTMEGLLFELLGFGLLFLSLSIATGFWFLESLTGRAGLIHHTYITLAAWIVFAVLIWGKRQLGWRGAVASHWTLAGFALLVMGYFGSKLVLELVLDKV